jgi:hypothetical protein
MVRTTSASSAPPLSRGSLQEDRRVARISSGPPTLGCREIEQATSRIPAMPPVDEGLLHRFPAPFLQLVYLAEDLGLGPASPTPTSARR